MKIDPNVTPPDYTTIRGKLLWIDKENYDDYSSAANCKMLVDANGKFWGYSDSGSLMNRDFGHGVLRKGEMY